jgi:hypothetical protein
MISSLAWARMPRVTRVTRMAYSPSLWLMATCMPNGSVLAMPISNERISRCVTTQVVKNQQNQNKLTDNRYQICVPVSTRKYLLLIRENP